MGRLFVAVELPDRIREALEAISHGLPGANWVRPDNLHLTLRFLGEMDEDEADSVRAQLESVEGSAFCLELCGLGQFLGSRHAETLWAAVAESEPLTRLRKSVDRAISAAGLNVPKKNFHAHVTVARLRNTPLPRLKEYLAEFGDFRTEAFDVDEFALISSVLRPEGAVYTIEESYRLIAREGTA